MSSVQKCSLMILSVFFIGMLAVTNLEAQMIESGKKVKLDYSLTIEGVLVETTEGKQPLEYTHGERQIIKGLSDGLEGMKAGEKKTIVVSPEDGYGAVNQQAFREVGKDRFPADQELQAGQVVQLTTPDGGSLPGVIWEVRDETVIVNFNHPLAGKTLNFDISIVSIE